MITNAITTLVGYLITVGAVLLWVFFSTQKCVPRTFKTAMGTSLRTLPLFVAFLLICQWLAVSAVFASAVLGVALVILIGSFGLDPLSMGTIGILYVVQQWVLGWPDRAESVLDPPPPRAAGTTTHLDELVGEIGIASSALRPAGMVALGGKQYPAHSDLGYIDRDAPVRVVGRKETTLVVRTVDTASAGNCGRPGQL